MEMLEFILSKPTNFLGVCILILLLGYLMKFVCVLVVGVAEGLGNLRLFEIVHYHDAIEEEDVDDCDNKTD